MKQNEKKIDEKKKKKYALKAVGWATAHLPVLSHDTMECIVTQGLVGQHSAHRLAGLRYG